MASGYILNPRPDLSPTWQLLKTPVNISAIGGGQEGNHFFETDFSDDNGEVIDCNFFQSISVMMFTTVTAGLSPNVSLYGWSADGPIRSMGSIDSLVGNHSSPANDGWHASPLVHKSIKLNTSPSVGPIARGFDPTVEYRGFTSHAKSLNSDYNVNYLSATPAVQLQTNHETDFPSEFVVDFRNTRLKYFGLFFGAMPGGGVLGAIFKPLALRL